MIEVELYNDLVLITPQEGAKAEEMTHFSILKNEPFSFQLAYRLSSEEASEEKHFFVRVTSALDVKTYHVANVPILHSFEKLSPRLPIGLYPDILVEKKKNPEILRQTTRAKPGFRYIESKEKLSLAAYKDSWKQLWLIVNEDGLSMPTGDAEIRLELFDVTNEKMAEKTLTLHVIDAELPPQKLYYTNWFHNDCLSDFYQIPLFSDEYFKVMENYLKCAVKNGMNMLLTPAFTPALDTAIGEERMTVQLVQVEKEGDRYRFDFSLMERYLAVAQAAGIRYFEHSHLFTQWGAAHAPKVVATVNGKLERIFGWETDAAGEEYVSFLEQYLPAVRSFLRERGLEETTLFHFSDEPSEANLESYARSCERIRPLLEGCMVGDALSDVQYYESGLVQTPIARIHKAMDFVEKCEPLWLYYTGAECYDGLPNRLIQQPRERNRALGYMLYYYKVSGFLHWGYNYYYGRLAHGLYDPAMEPCCGFPNAGTSYSVYPARDRTCMQSIHQRVFTDGLLDLRALELLESLSDRETCQKIIEEHLGVPRFFNTPENPEKLMAFRRAVNQKIDALVSTPQSEIK